MGVMLVVVMGVVMEVILVVVTGVILEDVMSTPSVKIGSTSSMRMIPQRLQFTVMVSIVLHSQF
jgi:hypothetical protein